MFCDGTDICSRCQRIKKYVVHVLTTAALIAIIRTVSLSITAKAGWYLQITRLTEEKVHCKKNIAFCSASRKRMDRY